MGSIHRTYKGNHLTSINGNGETQEETLMDYFTRKADVLTKAGLDFVNGNKTAIPKHKISYFLSIIDEAYPEDGIDGLRREIKRLQTPSLDMA